MRRTVLDERKLRIRMAEVGVNSLRELNARAGLGANTIYGVINRDGFYTSTLDAIADALGCDPLSLLSVEVADTQVSAPDAIAVVAAV